MKKKRYRSSKFVWKFRGNEVVWILPVMEVVDGSARVSSNDKEVSDGTSTG